VDLKVPNLPAGIEQAVSDALRRGDEPDSTGWPAHYHGHFLGVAGESFNNPDGTSRQKIIKAIEPGNVAYLMVEPDNEHDGQAVRVLVPHEGMAAQIGYLPRDHGMAGEVSVGRVAAWFAKRRRSQGRQWGAVLYILHTEP
jgi:hypothetical protein